MEAAEQASSKQGWLVSQILVHSASRLALVLDMWLFLGSRDVKGCVVNKAIFSMNLDFELY